MGSSLCCASQTSKYNVPDELNSVFQQDQKTKTEDPTAPTREKIEFSNDPEVLYKILVADIQEHKNTYLKSAATPDPTGIRNHQVQLPSVSVSYENIILGTVTSYVASVQRCDYFGEH